MKTGRSPLQGITLIIGLLILVTGLAVSAEPDGKQIYAKRCASCHGEDGQGETRAGQMMNTPNLLTAEWKQGTTVEELVTTLCEGLGKMPKYEGKLSQKELEAVSLYTLELTGKKDEE